MDCKLWSINLYLQGIVKGSYSKFFTDSVKVTAKGTSDSILVILWFNRFDFCNREYLWQSIQ